MEKALHSVFNLQWKEIIRLINSLVLKKSSRNSSVLKKVLHYGCIPLGWSGSGSVIRDHSDHGRSNEPMNPPWTRIHRFIWSTMIQVISDHWSWSGSYQRNAPYVFCRTRSNKLDTVKSNNVLTTTLHQPGFQIDGQDDMKLLCRQCRCRFLPPEIDVTDDNDKLPTKLRGWDNLLARKRFCREVKSENKDTRTRVALRLVAEKTRASVTLT